MELEATQAAGLVLGVKSYGASDELDYHSAWDHIKVAAEAEHGLLKKRPALADVAHDESSNTCRATCANNRPCNNQVHPNAGQDGHCAWTCGLHKNKRPEELRAPEDNTQQPDEETPPPDDGEQSDADIVVSDSDDEDDLFARDNVNAKAAAGMADERPPVARVVGDKPPGNREQPRPQTDLLKFFNADGGTTTGSSPVYQGVDGKPVPMCSAFNYAYRDSRLHAFTPVEFRQRFKVEKMDAEKLVLHKLWDSAARYISAWWRLKDRRGRAAAYEQRLYDVPAWPTTVTALAMTSSDDEWTVECAAHVECFEKDSSESIELNNVLRHAKDKVKYLKEKIIAIYGYDPDATYDPNVTTTTEGYARLDARDRAHASLLKPEQLAVDFKHRQMKDVVDAIESMMDARSISVAESTALQEEQRQQEEQSRVLLLTDANQHILRRLLVRYVQAVWRSRCHQTVGDHRMRLKCRAAWLSTLGFVRKEKAKQAFLAIYGSVAQSERKQPYGEVACNHLTITSLSPPYRLTVASRSLGGRVVLPPCAPPAPRSIRNRAANKVGRACPAG